MQPQPVLSIPIEPGDDGLQMADVHTLLAKTLAGLPDAQISSTRHQLIQGMRYEVIETPDGPRLVLYPLTREPRPNAAREAQGH